MLAFVIEVYLTAVKKRITAMVFNMALQITKLNLFGLSGIFVRQATTPDTINPTKNLKKVTSIPGISVPVEAYLPNTVARAKLKSAISNKKIPLYFIQSFKAYKNKHL
jgi:hypothetical protein